MDVFVVDKENFKYDFLIGLDCIKKFQLIQNEKLEITQKIQVIPEDKVENKMNLQNSKNNPKKGKENINEYKINYNEHIDTRKFQISINNLEMEQQAEIDKLIDKYKTVFAKDKYDIGTVRDYEAHIDLIIDKYCCKRPYRCSIEDKKEIEQQITKLLEKNLIEESYSPFAAPVTLAFKRDEDKRARLCIDFRELNKIVIPQPQPFPLIEDLIVKTRNCKLFSTLDINSAFWSIPLKIADGQKTAFVTQEGHYQWTCLPFGLKTAPAIFQRILNNIIRKHKLANFCVNYIDDILVFSRDFAEHIDHLSRLLKSIMEEGFRLKFPKCIFAADSVKYLGHIIRNNSVSPLKDNVISIKNFPIPKTRKNVRQFLGKINFYGKYVPNISIVLDPLHNLLRKEQKFTW
ncbi:gag-pol fusion protein [Lasius niger]|uniref:Gag-pol fusion protein n=1 Tax=Lasius niger TaxID=67767 RepID=A0A0J7K974_LASNI|nr:gag-pol fusion protein [Lasius niger]